jgi:glucose-6-phosphate-specific signal transduction histidine kinase
LYHGSVEEYPEIMNNDEPGALILVVIPVCMLMGHFFVSALIWRHLAVRVSLLLLILLSITTYFLIYAFAAAVGTYLALSIDDLNTPADRVYQATLQNFLFSCEMIPGSSDALGPDICNRLSIILWPPLLYLIGVLPSGLLKHKAQPDP